ncbi:hypothetical protein NFIA_084320 [Paecilomyces variotii No. 5]|uniref:Nuclear speckle splicing regulatory protein 1 N-terminal domain-containing protein n=1 Tax=Byssochlamys spectabilis (strain No. 5 / NBRC 109023) TaxID=1356009 RepID=V5F9Z4_BYSSN|nr:hypothetical protein NFIA_084320 [Paecilomyces variotii No. 5]
MPPPKLSYGLNLPSKNKGPSLGKPNLAAGQKRKKTIFDDDSDDEGNAPAAGSENISGEIEITSLGGIGGESAPSRSETKNKKPSLSSGPPPKRKPESGKPTLKPLKNSLFGDDDEDDGDAPDDNDNNNKSKPRATGTAKDYTNLAALHSTRKHAQTAQDLDPSIYSYDAIYDSIHKKPEKSTSDAQSSGPKYMTSLMRSAEVRKRDQMRARDRMLAKEREEEGDEFADKEKFVTAAYKAQQEEIRRLEEEEARREKEEEERRKREGGSGMVNFYRDVLARGEERHSEAVKAAEEAAQRVKAGEIKEEDIATDSTQEKSEAQLAAELNAKGAHIVVNDEGQIVDKRQLLTAGLNVAPKPKQPPSTAAKAATDASRARPGQRPVSEAYTARNAQRARQTEMVAAQLEERARKEAEAEEARQREIAERARTRKTEKDVSSAKERYLARKREREEAAKREKANQS